MSVRLRRLQAEHEKLKHLFEGHDRISIVETAGNPPDRYTIEYRVKGLVQRSDEIHTREVHRAKITLGPNFPKEMPQCVMLTPVFHPNIDHLAICTEDIGSAGQTIGQLIVFIGEMITYQAYNIQSPRNGEAAQWAKEHAAEFPLERVELTPKVLYEGVLRAPLASEMEKLAAAESCANCRATGVTAALQKCAGGHQTCFECALECANCRERLCILCNLSNCAACRSVVCRDCGLACEGCGHTFCLEHVRRCTVCGRYECSDCAKACVSGHSPPETAETELSPNPSPTEQASDTSLIGPERGPQNVGPTSDLSQFVPARELQQFAILLGPAQTEVQSEFLPIEQTSELLPIDYIPGPQQFATLQGPMHADMQPEPKQVEQTLETSPIDAIPGPQQLDMLPGPKHRELLDENPQPERTSGPQQQELSPVTQLTIQSEVPDIADAELRSSATGPEDSSQTAHDRETRIETSIYLTLDEVASVPESAIVRPPRHVYIGPEIGKRVNGKAIAALVFGIIGIPVLGILLGWFAILFVWLAKRDFRTNPALTGRSLATMALLLGIFDILLWLGLIATYGLGALRHAAPFAPSHAPSHAPNVASLVQMRAAFAALT